MPYQYDLGPGQKIYLENHGSLTAITLASGGPGQQQQSSLQAQTGPWTADPQVARVAGGLLVRCLTAQGYFTWQVQGTQVGAATIPWPDHQAEPMTAADTAPSVMPPMPPMPPMQPMRMGDMEMSANPMTMRMGSMALSMGNTTAPEETAHFCTQCGKAIAAGDRFCGSCGHQLRP